MNNSLHSNPISFVYIPISFVYILISLTIILGIAIIVLPAFNRSFAQSLFDGTQVAVPNSFSAKRAFNSGNILTDADVKNLLIIIPEKNLIDSIFLPTDATIVTGTKVIWINGEKDMIHGIKIVDETGRTVYSNSTIKFTNTTSFTFNKEGTYTYFDPNNPDDSGTMEVIPKEKSINESSTNSTTPSVGLFVAPKADKPFWDVRLNASGFHIVDSYEFKNINLLTLNDEAKERVLYLYTQRLEEEHSLASTVISQITSLEQQLSRKQTASFFP